MPGSMVETYQFQSLNVELRHNPSGLGCALPPHFHAEYQIILTQHTVEEYQYRGAAHTAHNGCLVILHPGEVHSARGLQDLQPFQPLRTMFARPDIFQMVMEKNISAAQRSSTSPFFAAPVLKESHVFSQFRHLHQALESSVSTLEKEVRMLNSFALLYNHHSRTVYPQRSLKPERASITRAREYLEDNYAHDVSLDRLSLIAGLSPFYLCRIFRDEVGLPPHVYQTQVRLARAKTLLALGKSIGEVAADTGFADQSHFTRQFRRVTGVTPGHYRQFTPQKCARSF